jgi:WhiB family redox-sensing transcriptional regulator
MIGLLRWQDEAACAGLGANLFFPADDMGGEHYEHREVVDAVCGGCPVRDECLEYALQWEEFGIWGGKTPKQRRAINRKRRVK